MRHELNWELDVLSQCVRYSNLTTSSTHVGLSQPQLSRIITKIEEIYGIKILDRSAKRKSVWTSDAIKLAETYQRTLHQFKNQIDEIRKVEHMTCVRIGVLDGLIPQALGIAKNIFESKSATIVEIIVDDFAALEGLFFKAELEFLISSRSPGQRKYSRIRTLGYQRLTPVGPKTAIPCVTLFEEKSLHKADEPHLLSNSLRVKEQWISHFGGHGNLPSALKKKPANAADDIEVWVLGLDHIPETLWKEVSELSLGDITP